eukprot:269608_1
MFQTNAFEIQFDIKLHHYCTKSLCNILYIGNNDDIIFPSLSIDGNNNYFEIITSDNNTFHDMYTIANANEILQVDHQFHRVYLKHTSMEKTFKIDNITYYNFRTLATCTSSIASILTHNLSLYLNNPWDESVNGIVSNICIKSLPDNNNDITGHIANINCGDTVNGFALQPIKYYLDLTYNASVTFYIYFDNILVTYLAQVNFDKIDPNCIYHDNCVKTHKEISTNSRRPAQIDLESLYSGKYMLSISEYFGNYTINLVCKKINTSQINSKYKLIPVVPDTYYSWQIERYCEHKYGTSLASLNTESDMNEALKLVNENSIRNGIIWIGLYRGIATNCEWKWIDGTECSTTTKCIDDVYWAHIANKSKCLRASPDPIGAYLKYSRTNNTLTIHATEYSKSYGHTYLKGTNAGEYDSCWALCHAAENSSVSVCWNKTNCWIQTHSFYDSLLMQDYTQWYLPMFFFTDSILFVLGREDIHYSVFNMEVSNVSFEWRHVAYPQSKNKTNSVHYPSSPHSVLHGYSHYEESVYWVGDGEHIFHLNIDNFETEIYDIPSFAMEEAHTTNTPQSVCLISTQNYLYVVASTTIWMYNINNGDWSKSSDFDVPDQASGISLAAACAISNDYQYIYIFPYYYFHNVLRYDIINDMFKGLSAPNLCYTGLGKGITAPNDKIYLQGCYIASWKTLVFNTITEKFEPYTVDIHVPTDIPQYNTAQMTVYDDNVLLLYHIAQNRSELYFTVTDKISFNFMDTTATIWPSHGFEIRYYVNDFDDNPTGSYYINMYSNHTSTGVNILIILNTSKDNCICNESSYKCYDCHQHFDIA